MKKEFSHFQPESIFAPQKLEGQKLEKKQNIEFVTDAKSGKIVKMGDPRDVRDWLEAQRKKNPDLKISIEKGNTVLPGMIDAHNHLIYGTLDVIQAGYVFDIESPKEMMNSIKKQTQNKNENLETPKILLGHNTALIPNIYRESLDEASPKRPICLVDISFHGARLNSKMIKLVKKVAEKEIKNGNKISGTLNEKTGQATEGFSLLAIQVAEAYHDIEKISEGMKNKIDEWVHRGITGIHEMAPLSWQDFIATLLTRKEWEKKEKTEFPVRQIFMFPELLKKLKNTQEELERAGLFNPNKDWGMIGMKLLADGSFGSHTAMLDKSYDDINSKGTEFHSIKELNNAIEMARNFGMEKIAMHAIGDRGIKRALETAKKWIKLAETTQIDPTRFRIEHFELSQEMLEETKSLGVWVNSEPNFLTDFIYRDRLSGRITQICPHADIIQKGIPMHFGSDGMPTSALFGIWAATHHPNSKERISFEQALAAYSLMGAEYEHNNGQGRIAEGASADIIVLKKETLNKLLQGDERADEFKKLGENSDYLKDKVSNLESGIAKIYREGKLIDKK